MPTINGDFAINPGETVEGEFVLQGSSATSDFTLLNRGTIHAVRAGGTIGVQYSFAAPPNGFITNFINEGLLDVINTDDRDAWGVMATGSLYRFVLNNTGEIRVLSARHAFGVEWDTDGPLVNDGLINVTATGGLATGVDFRDDTDFTNNETLIVRSNHGAYAVVAEELNNNTIINNGSITAETLGGPSAQDTIAIRIVTHFDFGGSAPDIINNGYIGGDWSIRVINQSSGQPRTVEWIQNNGEIVGDIDLLYGADRIDNYGKITGDVSMGDGADVINNADGEFLTGVANLGAGNDQYIGNALAETVVGAPGRDIIDGAGGDDTLSGGAGADTIHGNAGNDTIYGFGAGATGEIASSVFVNGLSAPVAAATNPATPGFLYIVEKDTGIIWRVNEATGAKTVFLDIAQSAFSNDGERGVLGLAFDPNFSENHRFYVFLTDPEGDLQVRRYVEGFAGSTLIIEIPKQTGFSNHNGGWIGFSPVDGELYIATGDGGGGGDPNNNAQNLDSLLGKILRINVDGDSFPGDPNRNYSISSTNPFSSTDGADEIWAYGVRNPWRLAFDPRNGDLIIADVGQGEREEVNYLGSGASGRNFGWRIMEGTIPYNPGPPGTPQPGDPSLTGPIFDYDHTLGNSITGGEVYLGAQAGFVGQYVFADFGSNRFFSLSVEDGAAVEPYDRTVQLTGALPSSVVDFVTGANGVLYAIGIGGTIWRIAPGVGAEDVGDTLFGDDGNDVITGGVGRDIIDGGRDIDTSVYAIASSAASWHRNPNGSWTITTGIDGTDTLRSVEFLDFTDRSVFLDRAYSTFGGDGTSDIFMQHSTGAMGVWFVGGAGVTGAAGLGALDSTWDLKGVGDFDGDSKDDILMWNDNGFLGMWFMNGASVSSAAGPGAIDKASWDIEAIGDLNGDGRDDILMWHNNGSLGVWFMNGAAATGAALGGVDKAAWDVEGLADFNGDGKDDILWKDVNGNLGVWFMNGASASGAGLGNIGTAWDIEGLGDFNGDGRDDILMRHDNGAVGVWFMNGASATGVGLGNVSHAFSVAAVGDYNGDGRDDILWWNDNGSLGAWFMNGASATGLGYGAVSHDWVINPG